MNTKHTPGPWKCYATSHHAHDYRLERPNAQMPFEGNDAARANARLISKAPDLLELCNRALLALDEEEFPCLRNEIREIISEITGEMK